MRRALRSRGHRGRSDCEQREVTVVKKKRTKKRGHLRVVASSSADQQVTEALDKLLREEDLSWEEAEKHFDTLRQHLRRALPRLDEILRGSDVGLAESAVYALQVLDTPEADDLLLGNVYDTTLKDDVRMAMFNALQQREVEVDEEAFFTSLYDLPGVFQRMRERLLDGLSTNLALRQATVEGAQHQDGEQFGGWLEFLADSADPRILYALLPLLYLPDEQRVLLIVEVLDRLGHPAAAPALSELAEWHTSNRVRKAARATLGHLTMRGSARPADQSLPPAPLPPLQRAYLTTIDGDGGQAIGVVRRQEDGLLTVMSTSVNDHQGVRNCFATTDLPPEEWEDILADLSEGGSVPVDMPLSVCRRAFDEARRLTVQAGLPLPLDAEAWRDMVLGDDLPGVVEPAAPTLTPAEAKELLEDTDDLFDAGYFDYWFFNPDEIEPFLDEAERLEEERWEERWDRFVKKVVRRLASRDFLHQLRARLERQAALLAGRGEDDQARLAMAAAWGLDKASGVKPQDHPFLMEMVEASFDNVWEGWDEGWLDEDWDEEDWEDEDLYPHWSGPLPQTEDEWRAFIARAASPTQVISAWFEQYPPADIDEANEVANYLMALWNTTPRPELGDRTPFQMAGMPAPPVPPRPQHRPAPAPQPPPGPLTVDDVLDAVHEYYHESIDWEPTLKQEQVEGYLQDAQRQGASPDELMEIWDNLMLFHFFLDHCGDEVQSLDDLQPYHLSEWVTDFLRRKVMDRFPRARKQQLLETVRSLYAYLARSGDVDEETAQTVAETVAHITGGQRGLRRIDRPPPLGGETMMTVFHPTAGEFVYTLNDVWLLQVCQVDFQRNWQRMRKAAQRVPGAALKLRLIDRLRQAQEAGEDPFSILHSYPPEPPSLDAARHMFHEAEMTEARAW